MHATAFRHQQFIRGSVTGRPMKVDCRRTKPSKDKLAMAGGDDQSNDQALVLAEYSDDPTLNFQVVRGHHDRSHFGICRLQAYLAGAFAIEALERRFFAANQRNDDIPGIGDLGLLANDIVPVHDVIFDHGAAFDLQNKGIAATSEIAQRNRLAFLNSFQRAPRRDPSHQWKLLHLAIVYLILDRLRQLDNLDGTALIVAAANEAFFLESGNVLVHGGQRSELEAFANFFETWRVAVFGLKRHEVIENFFLPFGQSHVRASLLRIFSIVTLGERKANVKYDFRFALLSLHASNGAKPCRDIPKKSRSQPAVSSHSIGTCRISLIAHGAPDLYPGRLSILASIHAGISL